LAARAGNLSTRRGHVPEGQASTTLSSVAVAGTAAGRWLWRRRRSRRSPRNGPRSARRPASSCWRAHGRAAARRRSERLRLARTPPCSWRPVPSGPRSGSHLPDIQRRSASCPGNRIVQMKDVIRSRASRVRLPSSEVVAAPAPIARATVRSGRRDRRAPSTASQPKSSTESCIPLRPKTRNSIAVTPATCTAMIHPICAMLMWPG